MRIDHISARARSTRFYTEIFEIFVLTHSTVIYPDGRILLWVTDDNCYYFEKNKIL